MSIFTVAPFPATTDPAIDDARAPLPPLADIIVVEASSSEEEGCFFLWTGLAGTTPALRRVHMAHRHWPRQEGHSHAAPDCAARNEASYRRVMHDTQYFLLHLRPGAGLAEQNRSSR